MILGEYLSMCAPDNWHSMDDADRFEALVDKIPHDVYVLENLGLSDHGVSHETVVVIIIKGTMIFHLTEVNVMNPVHLYGTACLV